MEYCFGTCCLLYEQNAVVGSVGSLYGSVFYVVAAEHIKLLYPG